MRKETKSKIYKATVRPIMTYALETRAETLKTRQRLEENEMKVLIKIVGKTKIGRIRSQIIRESCGIQPIKEWVKRRRREWDEHATRMDDEGLVKTSKDNMSAKENLRTLEKNMKLLISLTKTGTAYKKKEKKREQERVTPIFVRLVGVIAMA